MSIEQTNVVDAIGIERTTGIVVLTITDHLDWSDEDGHLRMLQDKINAYVRFVESGELCTSYPRAAGRPVRFNVVGKHEPGSRALNFLEVVRAELIQAGVEFTFRVHRGD